MSTTDGPDAVVPSPPPLDGLSSDRARGESITSLDRETYFDQLVERSSSDGISQQ